MRMNGPKPNEKYALPSPPRMRSAVIASIAGTAHTAKLFHALKMEGARGRVRREGINERAKAIRVYSTTPNTSLQEMDNAPLTLHTLFILKFHITTTPSTSNEKKTLTCFFVSHLIASFQFALIILTALARSRRLASPSLPSSVW